MKDLAKEYAIKQRFFLPYNLQVAGLVERKNGVLKQHIKLIIIGNTTLTG